MHNKLFSTQKFVSILLCVCIILSLFIITSCTANNPQTPQNNSAQSVQGNSGSNNQSTYKDSGAQTSNNNSAQSVQGNSGGSNQSTYKDSSAQTSNNNSAQSVQGNSGDNNQSSHDSQVEPEGTFIDGKTEYVDDLLLSRVYHDIRYTETGKSVFSDKQTDYVIVVPADTSSTMNVAKSELAFFFREATGCTITAVSDTGLVYSSEKKYISLGRTTIADEAEVTTKGLSLKTQGFIIRTIGQSIFIMGEDTGVLMGVYKLLNIWFDFDQMNESYYELRHGVQTVPLYDFNITDVPDIDYRLPPYGSAYNNKTVCRRMCMTSDKDIFIDGTESHDMLRTIVPYEEYRDTHPKWFMTTSTDETEHNQLCYTAHGDADEYAKMVDCACEHLKTLIINDPYHNVATLTQMDSYIWCSCDSCAALKKKYDTDAVSQILFANDVVAKLKTWLRDEMNGREVEFVIFAYHKTQKAPSVRNEKGEWVPIDDTVLMKDVSIWLAPIGGNYVDSVFSSKNVDLLNTFESWLPIAPKFLFWGYDCHFEDYLVPFDTYRSMQDTIKEAVRCNTSLFWAQGSYNLRNSTSFDNVKSYVYSKLMWNCQLNINDIIHDYFTKTYRAAASTMEEAYWTMRTLLLEQEKMGAMSSIWNDPVNESTWPSHYLFGQLELFEKAKSELAVYKESDPDYYATAIKQVCLESIGPRSLLIRVYPSAFSDREFDEFLDEFAADVKALDVNQFGEKDDMKSFLEKYNK